MLHMDPELRATLDAYARRYGLSPSQKVLLQHAVNGLRGSQLAAAMGSTVGELGLLESLFRGRTGRTLQMAVKEIDGVVRQRSSRPPSVRTPRPESGIAPRPGAKPTTPRGRTGTSEDE